MFKIFSNTFYTQSEVNFSLEKNTLTDFPVRCTKLNEFFTTQHFLYIFKNTNLTPFPKLKNNHFFYFKLVILKQTPYSSFLSKDEIINHFLNGGYGGE
jgi:hypothetical protein